MLIPAFQKNTEPDLQTGTLAAVFSCVVYLPAETGLQLCVFASSWSALAQANETGSSATKGSDTTASAMNARCSTRKAMPSRCD
jgi:hypothetical protein